jgi:hypothetical protein
MSPAVPDLVLMAADDDELPGYALAIDRAHLALADRDRPVGRDDTPSPGKWYAIWYHY